MAWNRGNGVVLVLWVVKIKQSQVNAFIRDRLYDTFLRNARRAIAWCDQM